MCIILIGDKNFRLAQELKVLFKTKPVYFHIPFINSNEQPEWIEWTKKNSRQLGGIGPGAAGCLIGHRRAWEILEARDFDFAVVLEADAVVTSYGKKHLEEFVLNFKESGKNIIHLGSHEDNLLLPKFKNIVRWSLRNILKEIYERVILKFSKPITVARRFPFSTHAYLINRSAASELSKVPLNFLSPVDVLLNSYSQVTLNKIATVRTPLLVQQSNNESLTRKIGR